VEGEGQVTDLLVWSVWVVFFSFWAGVAVAELKLDRLLLRIMEWARGKARTTIL